MHSRIIFLCLFVFTQWAVAGVEMSSSINDIYYRSPSAAPGSVTFTIGGTDFDQVSAENPFYFRLRFTNNAKLNLTRVKLDSTDGTSINQPILLGMSLHTSSDTAQVVANQDAVSILRWVEGESEIWIRVNQPSTQWIQDGETTRGLLDGEFMEFTLGTLFYTLDHIEEEHKNLPYNIRQGFPEALQETVFCLDLTESDLAADGTMASLMSLFPTIYQSDVTSDDINFNEGTQTECQVTSSFHIGRAKDIQIIFDEEHPGPSHVSVPFTSNNQTTEVSARFRMLMTASQDTNHLPPEHGEGSVYAFSIPNDAPFGFVLDGSSWHGAGDAFINHYDPVNLDGETVYKRLAVTFSNRATAFQIALLDLDLKIAISSESVLEEYTIDYNLQLPVGGLNGGACLSYPQSFKTGTFQHSVITSGRMIPHITRADGNFASSVLIANPDDDEMAYSLAYYDELGTFLKQDDLTVGPNRTDTHSNETIIPATAAYLRILNNDRVKASIVYQAFGSQKSPAQVVETSDSAKRWRIYPGQHKLTYDAAAMVNVGTEAASITVLQINAEGMVTDEVVLDTFLSPGQKETLVFSNLLTPSENQFYEILSTQPLSILALRGDWSSQYLWANTPVKMD